VRSAADVAALRPVRPAEDLGFVLESISQARAALGGEVPLIGFAGAPFTLASYAIEGGGSRNYVETKRLMYGQPEAWHDLMGRLAGVVAEFLLAQVAAGAQAVQLFDSWVGALSPDDYAEYAYPYTERIFSALADRGVPRIHFGTGANTLLPLMANAGCDVIGLDWRIALDDGWAAAGADLAVQGNLDPVVLFAPEHEIERRVLDVVKRADGRPGHIFNLGHGILPQTPPEAVGFVADLVHRSTRRES
jgi:uroporphyrinogen decarboxylase